MNKERIYYLSNLLPDFLVLSSLSLLTSKSVFCKPENNFLFSRLSAKLQEKLKYIKK